MFIKLVNVTKAYDGKAVLDNFSALVKRGSICMVGGSGIGKTTLLNLILGLQKPDSGEILFLNDDGTQARPAFAAVFQEDRLCENISAVKNVFLVCPKGFEKENIRAALNRVGLSDSLDKPVANFSGGMKRRVAIVRALISGADIIVMDEPLKGLDEKLKKETAEYIKESVKDKIFISVTHDKHDMKLLDAALVRFTPRGLVDSFLFAHLPESGK